MSDREHVTRAAEQLVRAAHDLRSEVGTGLTEPCDWANLDIIVHEAQRAIDAALTEARGQCPYVAEAREASGE